MIYKEKIVISKLIFLGLLVMAVSFITASHADDLLSKMESQNRESQLQIEKSRLQIENMRLKWQVMEAENAKNDAEHRLSMKNYADPYLINRGFTSLLSGQDQLGDAIKAKNSAEEIAENAEADADEARTQLVQVKIRYKNQTIVEGMILAIACFIWWIFRKIKKEGFMKYNEKFGIVVILACGLLILFSLMISQPWFEQLDLFQNLMTTLQINLFPESGDCGGMTICNYLISFHTKYAVLALLTLAAYGFTTYLGITPALKKPIHKLTEIASGTNK